MLHANFYPSEIINPFTGERRIVLPYALTFPNTDVTEPLFPGVDFGQSFQISPNGQYSLVFETDGTLTLYDLQTRSILRRLEDISDTGGWTWAVDSMQLAFYGRNLAQENRGEGIHIYDIGLDTITFLSDLAITDAEESIMLDEESWSPNENYITFARTTDIFGRYIIEILDTVTGEIIPTCLTNFYTDVRVDEIDVAWSEDSRYLASYGLLAEPENANTGTIYIYDMDTGRTFGVFTGDASLIGWTHSDLVEMGQ
jgi:WD40 repeat protein